MEVPSTQTGLDAIPGVGTRGGAAQVDLGIDPISKIAWGRWQAGWINSNPELGAMPSLHYFTVPNQTVAINLPITGTFNYVLSGNTTPTDNFGNQGTLTTATFSANFTAQQVNVAIGTTMPNGAGNAGGQTVVGATANNLPILAGGSFNAPTPTMSCTGQCGALSGAVGGQFSGPTGAGAGVGYGLTNGTQVISGAAVFRR